MIAGELLQIHKKSRWGQKSIPDVTGFSSLQKKNIPEAKIVNSDLDA